MKAAIRAGDRERSGECLGKLFAVGALIIAYTILVLPCYTYSIINPKTLVELLRPLHYAVFIVMFQKGHRERQDVGLEKGSRSGGGLQLLQGGFKGFLTVSMRVLGLERRCRTSRRHRRQLIREFPKIGVPLFGVLIIRILLFRVLY